MKADVLAALSGRFPKTIPCKESLNDPKIMMRVSGVDPFEDTARAFDVSWRKLGIDIHVAPPAANAARPRVPGGTWVEGGKIYADIGVRPTAMPLEYAVGLDKSQDDWVFRYDTSRDDFDLAKETAKLRAVNADFRRRYGDLAVMYHLYYTTLFMWPVVTFDWEPFLINATLDPERFDRLLWEPWSRISRKHFELLAAMDEEVVFCHDDLSMTTGPVFPPDYYEKHIFPRYERIMEPVKKAGKKLVYVCDGNMDAFLDRLLDFPIAAIMFENPATPFERVLETWGKAKRGFIGGISTKILSTGTPAQVREHTAEVIEMGRRYPGFVISSCGGLHGDIPLENMLAYFETRHSMGIPADLTRG
jgi:hypothetical protein